MNLHTSQQLRYMRALENMGGLLHSLCDDGVDYKCRRSLLYSVVKYRKYRSVGRALWN